MTQCPRNYFYIDFSTLFVVLNGFGELLCNEIRLSYS